MTIVWIDNRAVMLEAILGALTIATPKRVCMLSVRRRRQSKIKSAAEKRTTCGHPHHCNESVAQVSVLDVVGFLWKAATTSVPLSNAPNGQLAKHDDAQFADSYWALVFDEHAGGGGQPAHATEST